MPTSSVKYNETADPTGLVNSLSNLVNATSMDQAADRQMMNSLFDKYLGMPSEERAARLKAAPITEPGFLGLWENKDEDAMKGLVEMPEPSQIQEWREREQQKQMLTKSTKVAEGYKKSFLQSLGVRNYQTKAGETVDIQTMLDHPELYKEEFKDDDKLKAIYKEYISLPTPANFYAALTATGFDKDFGAYNLQPSKYKEFAQSKKTDTEPTNTKVVGAYMMDLYNRWKQKGDEKAGVEFKELVASTAKTGQNIYFGEAAGAKKAEAAKTIVQTKILEEKYKNAPEEFKVDLELKKANLSLDLAKTNRLIQQTHESDKLFELRQNKMYLENELTKAQTKLAERKDIQIQENIKMDWDELKLKNADQLLKETFTYFKMDDMADRTKAYKKGLEMMDKKLQIVLEGRLSDRVKTQVKILETQLKALQKQSEGIEALIKPEKAAELDAQIKAAMGQLQGIADGLTVWEGAEIKRPESKATPDETGQLSWEELDQIALEAAGGQ